MEKFQKTSPEYLNFLGIARGQIHQAKLKKALARLLPVMKFAGKTIAWTPTPTPKVTTATDKDNGDDLKGVKFTRKTIAWTPTPTPKVTTATDKDDGSVLKGVKFARKNIVWTPTATVTTVTDKNNGDHSALSPNQSSETTGSQPPDSVKSKTLLKLFILSANLPLQFANLMFEVSVCIIETLLTSKSQYYCCLSLPFRRLTYGVFDNFVPLLPTTLSLRDYVRRSVCVRRTCVC